MAGSGTWSHSLGEGVGPGPWLAHLPHHPASPLWCQKRPRP